MALLGEWMDQHAFAGQDKISAEQYEQEGVIETQREIEKLEDTYRTNVSRIDRTQHFRNQFIGFAGNSVKFHIPSLLRVLRVFFFPYSSSHYLWPQNEEIDDYKNNLNDRNNRHYFLEVYKDPVSLTFRRVLFVVYNLMHLYSMMLLLSAIWGEPVPFREWLPVIGYVFVALVYAAQVSVWSSGMSIGRHKVAKLASLQMIVFDHTRQETPTTAAHATDALIRHSLKLKPKSLRFSAAHKSRLDLTKDYNTKYLLVGSLVALLVAVGYELIPLIWFLEIPTFSFIKIYRGVLEIMIIMSIVGELVINIYKGLYQRYNHRMVRKKVLSYLGYFISHRKAQEKSLPYFCRLNTPENVAAFAAMRAYLQNYQSRRIGFLQVILAFVAIFSLAGSTVMFVEAYQGTRFVLDDVRLFYAFFVMATFLLASLFIGSGIDKTQKNHIKSCQRIQWRLNAALASPGPRAATLFEQPESPYRSARRRRSGTPLRAHSKSNGRNQRNSSNEWDSEDEVDRAILDLARDDNEVNGNAAVPSPPRFSPPSGYGYPLSPVSLTKCKASYVEIAQEASNLLGRLIEEMKTNDQPLKLLGVGLTNDLLVKVASLVLTALGSRMFRAYSSMHNT